MLKRSPPGLLFCATIMLMIIAILVVFGLCLGSFVNALVWRVHEQAELSSLKKPSKQLMRDLSISKGRSMCPHCHHTLGAQDLIPVISWLSLKGKCQYCKKPIAWQYPLVEIVTAALFVLSYLYWPATFTHPQIAIFSLWLLLLVGFMALLVYDIRWMLLPNRIIYPLGGIVAIQAVITVLAAPKLTTAALAMALSIALGGGIFYLLYQVSGGKWIGGGDVRLGWIFGAAVAAPEYSVMVIFLASLLGCAVAIPFLLFKRLKGNSVIPFGPFLIAATILVRLFGPMLLHCYTRLVSLS